MKGKKRFSIKAADSDVSGEVTAVIATLGVIDLDGDVTESGAFGEQETVIVPAHNWSASPLGKAAISERNDEAVARMKFNLDSEAGREWYSALKFDFENGPPVQQYSYGFDLVEYSFGEFEGAKVRFLKQVKVLEVSPVIVGAGMNTRTVAVKAGLVSMEQEFKMLSDALDDIRGFHSRCKALAFLRAKEGRTLSAANRERLSQLLEAIGSIGKEISTFLSETEPDSGKGAQLFAEFQKVKFELNRVIRG